MFERFSEPVSPKVKFLIRLARHFGIALGMILGSLVIGIAGYHMLAHLSWIDSTLNASMILAGMGPVNELKTTGAKLFASIYALFAGIIFLVAAGVFFAPILHRFLHHLHLAGGSSK